MPVTAGYWFIRHDPTAARSCVLYAYSIMVWPPAWARTRVSPRTKCRRGSCPTIDRFLRLCRSRGSNLRNRTQRKSDRLSRNASKRTLFLPPLLEERKIRPRRIAWESIAGIPSSGMIVRRATKKSRENRGIYGVKRRVRIVKRR